MLVGYVKELVIHRDRYLLRKFFFTLISMQVWEPFFTTINFLGCVVGYFLQTEKVYVVIIVLSWLSQLTTQVCLLYYLMFYVWHIFILSQTATAICISSLAGFVAFFDVNVRLLQNVISMHGAEVSASSTYWRVLSYISQSFSLELLSHVHLRCNYSHSYCSSWMGDNLVSYNTCRSWCIPLCFVPFHWNLFLLNSMIDLEFLFLDLSLWIPIQRF